MFTDKIEVKDLDKMDPEYHDLLRRVLTIQADCEIGGPHLYLERMLPAAPTKLDQLIVARTATEEIDHFRKVARVAGDMGVDVSFVLSQSNEKRFVDAFRGLITTWEDHAVFGFLIDRVGRYQLEEFYDCSYLPLQRILPDIVSEELGHIEYGYNKTRELLSKGDEQKERVQKAIDYWYVRALDMFGRSGSRRAERYRYWGLKRRANEQARMDYVNEVNPILESIGLKIPDPFKGDATCNPKGVSMRQPLPTNERLDEHLLEVVCVLRAAIKQGLSHPNDTEMANRAIADSKEILDVIMAGNVNEWLD